MVEVTNLRDLNRAGQAEPGSFRAALNSSGNDPITIVFKVSGLIELSSELKSGRSNMTIAGQTAPGDGICVKNESIKLSGSNLIVRYVRFRPGDELKGQASGLNIENAHHVIVDHCSMSWAIEENMGFYDNKFTTVQWCIISEGLYNSYHSKGPRGYGSQWGGQYASYHHNLIAHNRSRSPRINGSRAHDTVAVVDFRNNVIFNWGSSGAIYGGEQEIFVSDPEDPDGNFAGSFTNFINNYYQPGPATPSSKYFAAPSHVTAGNEAYGYGQWYFDGNYMEGVTGGMNDDNWLGVDVGRVGSVDNIRALAPFEVSEITTQSALQAKSQVLTKAGATLPKRDSVDLRLVMEINGQVSVYSNGIIDSQEDVGSWPEYASLLPEEDTDGDGMPDAYELENNLDPNDPVDGKAIGGDGYSNLEVYLNQIAGVTGVSEEVEVLSAPRLVGFEVFPNPTSGELSFNSAQQMTGLVVYDLNGKAVLSEEFGATNTYSSDISAIQNGIYIVKMRMINGAEVKTKIAKE